jgi:hypothetical protein
MFMEWRSQLDKSEKWAYFFLDVLSAVPPFSQGTARCLKTIGSLVCTLYVHVLINHCKNWICKALMVIIYSGRANIRIAWKERYGGFVSWKELTPSVLSLINNVPLNNNSWWLDNYETSVFWNYKIFWDGVGIFRVKPFELSPPS